MARELWPNTLDCITASLISIILHRMSFRVRQNYLLQRVDSFPLFVNDIRHFTSIIGRSRGRRRSSSLIADRVSSKPKTTSRGEPW
jgi:hypothetical protein